MTQIQGTRPEAVFSGHCDEMFSETETTCFTATIVDFLIKILILSEYNDDHTQILQQHLKLFGLVMPNGGISNTVIINDGGHSHQKATKTTFYPNVQARK